MERFRRDHDALTPSFFATDGSAYIDQSDIEKLKVIATRESSPVRFSLHQSPAKDLHSMMILHPRGTYSQPRKHRTRSKIFHIVEGEMVVVTFGEDGATRAAHHLALDKVIVVHIEPDSYHTNFAVTRHAVYHEVIIGPFDRTYTDRVFAPFAPGSTDHEIGLAYMRDKLKGFSPNIGPGRWPE